MGERERDLTRDEVFVGGTRLPQEWARDTAYANYRLIKAGGRPVRAAVIVLLVLVVVADLGVLDDRPWMLLVFGGIVAISFVAGALRVRSRGRHAARSGTDRRQGARHRVRG